MKNLVIVGLSVALFLNTSFGKDVISKFTSPSEEQTVSQISTEDKEQESQIKKTEHKHSVKSVKTKKDKVKQQINKDTNNSPDENWKKVKPLNLEQNWNPAIGDM